MTAMDWPSARLDRIARLRVLAAALPHVSMAEALIDAPFARVWEWFADMEASVPTFDGQVRRLRVTRRDGERLRVMSWAGPGGAFPLPFDVRLEEGWCLMSGAARLYIVGMAAEPAGDQTHMGVLEGVARPGGGLMRPAIARHVRGDLRGVGRALGVSATAIASPPAADDPGRRRTDPD
jgi:hypothetical protein